MPTKKTVNTADSLVTESSASYESVKLSLIDPNPYQPRTSFEESELSELAESIRVSGLIQPIQLAKRGERFALVAGQRRLEAVRKLGYSAIQAVVQVLSDEQLLQHSLVENLQREDLNPVDEAIAITKLMDILGLEVDAIAQEIGKSKTYVYDRQKIQEMSESMCDAIKSGQLGLRKALTMMKLEKEAQREKLLQKAFGYTDDKLSKIVANKLNRKPRSKGGSSVSFATPPSLKGFADTAGTLVKLGKEKVTFRYKSRDELIPLLEQVIAALKSETE